MLHRWASETLILVNYQHEVDKGKLTAIANFEKLKFQVWSLTLEMSAFQNLLQWLIYPYQLHVDN